MGYFLGAELLNMKDHILVADDDEDVISALTYLLSTEGYAVSSAKTPLEALDLLKESSFSLFLMDLNYTQDTTSGKEGLELILQAKKIDEFLPIVIMTAWGSIETAVDAMQKGARDFVQKPWDNERLLSVINNQILRHKAEVKTQKLEQENHLLRKQLAPKYSHIIAHSTAMRELMDQLEQVAKSDANILFTGENGTGKSLLAQYVHESSLRSKQTLISVNMGSISESLFESEMFGHVKGAFTDARENRIGRFELAGKGSLFLDEIGNTPYSQQAKLLRVLEEHQFEKVGSSRTQESDCRLICATNCDLDEAVNTGAFRKDLLYRINTITLRVPALKERKEDIIPLAEFFLQALQEKYTRTELVFSQEAQGALQAYDWPGNIRELSHAIERAVILSKNKEIGLDVLGLSQAKGQSQNIDDKTLHAELTLDELDEQIITARIKSYSGNSSKAAESLGLSQSAFYRRLEKYRIKGS